MTQLIVIMDTSQRNNLMSFLALAEWWVAYQAEQTR